MADPSAVPAAVSAGPGSLAAQAFEVLNYFEGIVRQMETWIEDKWLPSLFVLLDLVKTAHESPDQVEAKLLDGISNFSRLTDIARDKVSALHAFFMSRRGLGMRPALPPMEVVESVRYIANEADLRMETLLNLSMRLLSLEQSGVTEELPEALRKRWRSVFMHGGGLMHDFNNINAVVLGFSDLAMGIGMSDGMEKAVGVFLGRMRRFSIDTVESAMNVAQSLYSARARKNGVQIDIHKNGDVFVPDQMKFGLFRGLSELILNGIKYSDPDKTAYDQSCPAAGCERQPTQEARYVRAEYEIHDDELMVVVSDNGVGMTDDQVERAFIPGERFHPHLATGTGNGLAGVLEFARAHGGDLRIASRKGVGTTMVLTVKFPNTPKSAQGPKSPPPTPPPFGGGSFGTGGGRWGFGPAASSAGTAQAGPGHPGAAVFAAPLTPPLAFFPAMTSAAGIIFPAPAKTF